jgi:flagellar biosynthesis protein FlhG
MTDAYALMKVLSRNHGVTKFFVLANQARSLGEGHTLFQKLQRVTGRFLDVTLEYVGEIPEDAYLRRAIREQRPVVAAFPSSPAARAFKKLALAADKWPVPECPRGNLEFFVERLVRKPQPRLEVVR